MAPETASVSGLVGRRPSASSSSTQPSTSNRRPQDRHALMDKDLLQRNVFVWPPIVPEDTESSEAMDATAPSTPNRNLAASSPTPEKLSPPPSQDFSGMTATKSGSGELSLFYVLDSKGRLVGDMDKLTELSKKEGGFMALSELMKPGLAAVQLTVPHPDPDVPSVSLSGFRLRHNGTDAVVTCSHFVQWPEVQEEFDKLARGYITMTGSVTATDSQLTSGIRDPHPFSLQLVAVHRPWDLAIFRIVEKPPDKYDDAWGTVVDFHNLCFATRADWDGLRQLDLWWSVGYNLNYNEAEFQSSWDSFWQRQTPEVRNEIVARYGFDGKSKPSNEILKPNLRTVCFGTLDEKSPTGFPEVAHQMAINLSAWHGRSGSMVCTRSPPEVRQRDDPGKSPVSICGVVAGGHARSDQNTMILFTNDMKDWFGKALEPRDDFKVNDKEFHQRFVMAP